MVGQAMMMEVSCDVPGSGRPWKERRHPRQPPGAAEGQQQPARHGPVVVGVVGGQAVNVSGSTQASGWTGKRSTQRLRCIAKMGQPWPPQCSPIRVFP